MGIIIGLIIALTCMLGGFAAIGGKISVLIQPWEFVIILGSAFGIFITSNPFSLIKDTAQAIVEALKEDVPQQKHYLSILGLLYVMMREMRSKPHSEVENHIDNPYDSPIFQSYPAVLHDYLITHFICDYCRLVIIGNARSFEIEALMDEEIRTIFNDSLKPCKAIQAVADALPALGIIAAILGVIKVMGALNEEPEVLGHLIGAALVGTFAGIFFSYSVFSPIAIKIRSIKSTKTQMYTIIKQTLLAYMNGATPQIALEYGRKTISAKNRPSIDIVEQEAMTSQSADTMKNGLKL
ncbi:MAG: chemotaxis protein MotA [Candidatus Tokpelaia sp. JSC188]|nr:MAG: chemotaxis protein MotA [Candidatus Tokpelaia sp. JSC188]